MSAHASKELRGAVGGSAQTRPTPKHAARRKLAETQGMLGGFTSTQAEFLMYNDESAVESESVVSDVELVRFTDVVASAPVNPDMIREMLDPSKESHPTHRTRKHTSMFEQLKAMSSEVKGNAQSNTQQTQNADEDDEASPKLSAAQEAMFREQIDAARDSWTPHVAGYSHSSSADTKANGNGGEDPLSASLLSGMSAMSPDASTRNKQVLDEGVGGWFGRMGYDLNRMQNVMQEIHKVRSPEQSIPEVTREAVNRSRAASSHSVESKSSAPYARVIKATKSGTRFKQNDSDRRLPRVYGVKPASQRIQELATSGSIALNNEQLLNALLETGKKEMDIPQQRKKRRAARKTASLRDDVVLDRVNPYVTDSLTVNTEMMRVINRGMSASSLQKGDQPMKVNSGADVPKKSSVTEAIKQKSELLRLWKEQMFQDVMEETGFASKDSAKSSKVSQATYMPDTSVASPLGNEQAISSEFMRAALRQVDLDTLEDSHQERLYRSSTQTVNSSVTDHILAGSATSASVLGKDSGNASQRMRHSKSPGGRRHEYYDDTSRRELIARRNRVLVDTSLGGRLSVPNDDAMWKSKGYEMPLAPMAAIPLDHMMLSKDVESITVKTLATEKGPQKAGTLSSLMYTSNAHQPDVQSRFQAKIERDAYYRKMSTPLKSRPRHPRSYKGDAGLDNFVGLSPQSLHNSPLPQVRSHAYFTGYLRNPDISPQGKRSTLGPSFGTAPRDGSGRYEGSDYVHADQRRNHNDPKRSKTSASPSLRSPTRTPQRQLKSPPTTGVRGVSGCAKIGKIKLSIVSPTDILSCFDRKPKQPAREDTAPSNTRVRKRPGHSGLVTSRFAPKSASASQMLARGKLARAPPKKEDILRAMRSGEWVALDLDKEGMDEVSDQYDDDQEGSDEFVNDRPWEQPDPASLISPELVAMTQEGAGADRLKSLSSSMHKHASRSGAGSSLSQSKRDSQSRSQQDRTSPTPHARRRKTVRFAGTVDTPVNDEIKRTRPSGASPGSRSKSIASSKQRTAGSHRRSVSTGQKPLNVSSPRAKHRRRQTMALNQDGDPVSFTRDVKKKGSRNKETKPPPPPAAAFNVRAHKRRQDAASQRAQSPESVGSSGPESGADIDPAMTGMGSTDHGNHDMQFDDITGQSIGQLTQNLMKTMQSPATPQEPPPPPEKEACRVSMMGVPCPLIDDPRHCERYAHPGSETTTRTLSSQEASPPPPPSEAFLVATGGKDTDSPFTLPGNETASDSDIPAPPEDDPALTGAPVKPPAPSQPDDSLVISGNPLDEPSVSLSLGSVEDIEMPNFTPPIAMYAEKGKIGAHRGVTPPTTTPQEVPTIQELTIGDDALLVQADGDSSDEPPPPPPEDGEEPPKGLNGGVDALLARNAAPSANEGPQEHDVADEQQTTEHAVKSETDSQMDALLAGLNDPVVPKSVPTQSTDRPVGDAGTVEVDGDTPDASVSVPQTAEEAHPADDTTGNAPHEEQDPQPPSGTQHDTTRRSTNASDPLNMLAGALSQRNARPAAEPVVSGDTADAQSSDDSTSDDPSPSPSLNPSAVSAQEQPAPVNAAPAHSNPAVASPAKPSFPETSAATSTSVDTPPVSSVPKTVEKKSPVVSTSSDLLVTTAQRRPGMSTQPSRYLPPTSVMLSGWLKKPDSRGSHWNRRFCVLTCDALRYYKKKRDFRLITNKKTTSDVATASGSSKDPRGGKPRVVVSTVNDPFKQPAGYVPIGHESTCGFTFSEPASEWEEPVKTGFWVKSALDSRQYSFQVPSDEGAATLNQWVRELELLINDAFAEWYAKGKDGRVYSHASGGVLKEGYVEKLSKTGIFGGKKYRQRYIKLFPGQLWYYRSMNDSKPYGEIVISSAAEATSDDPEDAKILAKPPTDEELYGDSSKVKQHSSTHGKVKGGSFVFQVRPRSQGRNFMFRVRSKWERIRWLRAIQDAIKLHSVDFLQDLMLQSQQMNIANMEKMKQLAQVGAVAASSRKSTGSPETVHEATAPENKQPSSSADSGTQVASGASSQSQDPLAMLASMSSIASSAPPLKSAAESKKSRHDRMNSFFMNPQDEYMFDDGDNSPAGGTKAGPSGQDDVANSVRDTSAMIAAAAAKRQSVKLEQNPMAASNASKATHTTAAAADGTASQRAYEKLKNVLQDESDEEPQKGGMLSNLKLKRGMRQRPWNQPAHNQMYGQDLDDDDDGESSSSGSGSSDDSDPDYSQGSADVTDTFR